MGLGRGRFFLASRLAPAARRSSIEASKRYHPGFVSRALEGFVGSRPARETTCSSLSSSMARRNTRGFPAAHRSPPDGDGRERRIQGWRQRQPRLLSRTLTETLHRMRFRLFRQRIRWLPSCSFVYCARANAIGSIGLQGRACVCPTYAELVVRLCRLACGHPRSRRGHFGSERLGSVSTVTARHLRRPKRRRKDGSCTLPARALGTTS